MSFSPETLAIVMGMIKKNLNDQNIGISDILLNDTNDSFIFILADGRKVERKINGLSNLMKTTDYDVDNNKMVDISKESLNSEKLGNQYAINYFNKIVDTTDDLKEGVINKFIKNDTINQINNMSELISVNSKDILTLKTQNNNTDELVKLNAMDTASYLSEKIDNSTIKIKNNKLTALTIDGLETTLAELNMIKGIKSNIQEQINSLIRGMVYKGQVATHADLLKTINPENGWTIIVKVDETQDGKKISYIYDGSKWEATYEVSSSIGRDFSIDGIDLNKETKGILPKEKIDTEIARKTDINNKIDKIVNSIENNIAIFSSDGSIKDAGSKLSDYSRSSHSHTDISNEISNIKLNMHNHINKDVLNKLSISSDGKLLFNNNLIEGSSGSGTGISTWASFEL